MPFERMSAVDDGPFVGLCDCAETPSIILAIFGSDACSSVLGFFLRAIAEACAFACFAASAAGSSWTSAYSVCILDDTLARCALSEGEVIGGAMVGRGKFSSADGLPKSNKIGISVPPGLL